jgi:hypothetical protein
VRSEIERLFAEAGLSPPDVRVETHASASLLLPLLRQSDLVAVLADQSVRMLAAEGLGTLETQLDALVGDITIVHRRLTPSTGLLMQVKDRLAARARSVFPG